ncbi:MAG: hypothetical protein FWB91_14035 [Defluviitaleaceae bacterium]|nr:hypothetical protein [Defluviitaleaceae bacterium]
MKNRLRFFGIIATVAIIGLSMTGCPVDPDETNGLEGTWRRTISVSPPVFDTLTFSGNTFQLRVSISTWNGTFAVDGDSLTFIMGAARHETTFSRSGGTLTIAGDAPFPGTWTRQ